MLDAQMRNTPDQQISLTDPDARSMATSGRGSGVVGYNVQVAVDTEHHLIVTHEVINIGNDRGQLARMSKQAKEVLEVDKLEAVADRGYFDGEEILAREEAGVAVTLPKPMTSNAKAEGRFGKQDFAYLPDEDVYRCPSDQLLPYHYTNIEHGMTLRVTGRQQRAKAARSRANVRRQRSAASRAGSMSMWSRRSKDGSIPIPTPCGRDARRSSIPSARSKPVWVRPTS